MTFAYIVLTIALLLLIMNFRSNARFKTAQRSGLYPPPGHGNDEDVLRLIQAKQKLLAIKLYRELHNCGLKEAKDAIDVMAVEGVPKIKGSTSAKKNQTDDEVRRLVETNQIIEAIKLYRKIHGCGLKEAKDAIDNM